jgi:hypothetical protein
VKCGRGDLLCFHHVNPVAAGGGDESSNLTLLCEPCHAEWHAIEIFPSMTLTRWLKVPALVLLIVAWEQEWPAEASAPEYKAALDALDTRNRSGEGLELIQRLQTWRQAGEQPP